MPAESEAHHEEASGDRGRAIPFPSEHAVWARLKRNVSEAPKYQLGLLFDTEFWYITDKSALHSPLSPATPPVLVLQHCLVRKATGSNEDLKEAAEFPVNPDADEIRQWEAVEQDTTCNVVCDTNSTMFTAGSRVTVSPHITDDKPNVRRSGFITDATNGSCRVRIYAGKKRLRVLSSGFMTDLLSTPSIGDEILVERDDLRPHFLMGDAVPGLGERVLVLAGPHKRRVGSIAYRQKLNGATVVGIRSGEMTLSNIAISHITRLFLPGDSVKIVYGHFSGEEGYVARTFPLNTKNSMEQQVPPGGILVQSKEVETLAQWVRFVRAPATNEAYDEDLHWLSRWDFTGKRLDVRIGASRRGRPSKVQQTYNGMDGFIEPKERVVIGKESGFMEVMVEQSAKRVRLQAECLEPIHDPMPPRVRLADKQKSENMLRVVVIGPDTEGSLKYVGKYGFVKKNEAKETHVLIKAVMDEGALLGEAIYARDSLCRATNADGLNTKTTSV
uniref:KOW domain-containing protein n=1 Tax=Mycena chlorophos TaxID=658473 RepID=A0ABQ0LBF7_MYCCL|nr:predicted protein [Mycena chlorophos]